MLSGSSVSNVVAVGSITIPAMKKIGYEPHFAGAIEACASTGGIIMPPVMGSIAFVMAELLGVEYVTVMEAAAIPALLYYFGLLMQVDAQAAKQGIRGLHPSEIPSLKKTIKRGWPFIVVLAFLVFGLVYMKWEQKAAFYSAGLLFLLSFTRKDTMMTPKRIFDTIVKTGTLITQTMAVLLPIGIIMNGLIVTGLILSFTSGVINLGGNSTYLLVLAGVVACYIMGMAGLLVPAYILLGVILAPALVKLGMNLIAVHMFILYYSCLASFTPPVAAAAFVAGAIARANPMRTSWEAAKLGVVIYLVPFFFLYNPALVLQGDLRQLIYLLPMALVGVSFIAWGLTGYMVFVGKIGWVPRATLTVGGFLIALPELTTTYIGIGMCAVTVLICLLLKKSKKQKLVSGAS